MNEQMPSPQGDGDPGLDVCVWTEDADEDKWDTTCGHAFTLITDGPRENKMAFCCYCGKPLEDGRYVNIQRQERTQ